MRKRLISYLLCIGMIVGNLPGVYADESIEEQDEYYYNSNDEAWNDEPLNEKMAPGEGDDNTISSYNDEWNHMASSDNSDLTEYDEQTVAIDSLPSDTTTEEESFKDDYNAENDEIANVSFYDESIEDVNSDEITISENNSQSNIIDEQSAEDIYLIEGMNDEESDLVLEQHPDDNVLAAKYSVSIMKCNGGEIYFSNSMILSDEEYIENEQIDDLRSFGVDTEISLQVSPYEGFEIEKIIVESANIEQLYYEVHELSGEYYFVMPEDDVIISARFIECSDDLTGQSSLEVRRGLSVENGLKNTILVEGTCGINLNWTLNNENMLHISGQGEMDDYSLDNVAPWYESRLSINTVIVDYGVTSIGNFAFKDCEELVQVDLPNSLTSIGQRSFYRCKSLSEISIPDTIQSIEIATFYECEMLNKIILPRNLISLGDAVFYGCINLIDISLPESLEDIGTYCFFRCKKLNSISLPGKIDCIDACAFRECESIVEITLPNDIIEIGEGAFYDCTNLETFSAMGNHLKIIGQQAFRNCTSLKDVYLPSSVDSIGQYVFAYTSSYLVLHGFEGSTIESYSNAYNISFDAMDSSLDTNIVYSGKCGDNVNYKVTGSGALLISGQGEMYNYSYGNNAPWCDYNIRNTIKKIVIDDGVTTIGNHAFYLLISVKNIVLPDGLEEIGEYSFEYCQALNTIEIPDSVTTIGKSAFDSCSSLQYTNIPSNLTVINNFTFYNCGSLKEITIPDGIKRIDTGAFYQCTGLSKVILPDSVNYISSAFQKCYKLTSAGPIGSGCNFEFGWTSTFPSRAFEDMESLETIIMPDTLKTISDSAFKGCSSLTEMVFLRGLEKIGSYVFSDCTSLTRVTIPSSTTQIGYSSFYNVSPDFQMYGYSGTEAQKYAEKEGIAFVELERRSIASCIVTIDNSEYVYDGSPKTPDVIIKDGKLVLDKGSDYDIRYENNTYAGNATMIITGIGEYTDKKEVVFSIISRSIEDALVEEIGERYYTGSPIKPSPSVSCNGIVLTAGKDYALSYKNNTDIGSATIIISGRGNYSGKKTCIFRIVDPQQTINDSFEAVQNYIIQNGVDYGNYRALKMPTNEGEIRIIRVKDGQINFIAETDNGKTQHFLRMWIYRDKLNDTLVDYSCFSDAGTVGALFFSCLAEARIDATKYHIGEKVEYDVTNVSFDQYRSLAEQHMDQNGTEYFELALNRWDFFLRSETGYGLYDLGMVNLFTTKEDISDANIEGITDATFKGTNITYNISVEKNGILLTPNKDYSVVYKNNRNVGMASVTVTGKGNYVGTKRVTFKITPKSLDSASIAAIEPAAYMSDGVKPTPIVKSGSAVLKSGTDYTTYYKNNTRVGKATLTVTGKGNYTGTKTVEFYILFTDVPKTHSFYKSVYWAVEAGIATGYSGTRTGLFGVNDGITRGQVVTFLWRAAGKPNPRKTSQTFSDVPTNHAFFKAIQWASEMGITGGYTGSRAGQFGPDDPCTRGQIATFLWRYAGKPIPQKNTQTFSDVPVRHSFFKSIQWASENGITAGYSDGTFGVNRTCSRGHCVTFLYRLIGR